MRLYSVKEVSKILGCNPNKVYELMNTGKLSYIQLGRKKVLEDTLFEYIKNNEVNTCN